ncbi:E3 ubiquitin-protein ligase TRIM11-like isoform X5 [Pelodiscus sinensis]|uniref:E3 ubiquitin-protein ligase TRIM11-like isoform X5 n=1 Tax=Pelodiscus sinensis TaxID=13735 RepID=UPI003F6D2202
MAAGDLARSFQDEATCPMCLEFFTDPVSIECGHNYCRACLSQCWGESEPKFSCPQCRVTILQRHLRPNYQLGNLVELVKCLRPPAGPVPEGQPGCKRHQEALKLFCQEDQAPICVVCDRSREHRAHTVVPIEEAAQEYKEKLQGALGLLREQLEEALGLRSEEEEKTAEWQRTVQAKREMIAGEFNKLHTLLREEEQLLLQRLAEEERETLQRLQENVTKLSQQSASLQQLIAEIEGKCQQLVAELLKMKGCCPDRELLLLLPPGDHTEHRFSFSFQDVKSTLSRSENMKLQGPEAICTDLQRGYKICLDLREALNRFAVDMTLDPDTANPWLVLSEDRKRVRDGDTRQDLPDNPERFDTSVCVLGAEGVTGGRRYWEVEVGDKTDWDLGICRESVSRKGEVTYTPENGYWVVLLRDGEYEAGTSPLLPLPVSARPSRVGVFLDYEAGKVSFYNVTDRSHLFTFTGTFSGMLCPFFSPGLDDGANTAPLTICPAPAHAGGNGGTMSWDSSPAALGGGIAGAAPCGVSGRGLHCTP